MEIKGFDDSFLNDPETESEMKTKEFLDKVMIPSNYFDSVASIAVLVSKSRGLKNPLNCFCEIIRNCVTKRDFLSYMDDVKDKESQEYQEIRSALEKEEIDRTISFATLSGKLYEYGFADERMFHFLMWILTTGSPQYLKPFGKFCQDTGRHIAAYAILTTMFQECRVILPYLYNIDEEDLYESLAEVYPDFYTYLVDDIDLDDMLSTEDFVDFLTYERNCGNMDASLVFDDLVDLVYDIFDSDDEDEKYSIGYFIKILLNNVLVEIHNKWSNKEKALAAQNLICAFIKNYEDEE